MHALKLSRPIEKLIGLLVLSPLLLYAWDVSLRPILFSNPAHGHEITCLSNLKQLDVAVQMYIEDWNLAYPSASLWGDTAARYLKPDLADRVFHCPDARTPFSYAYNRACSGLALEKLAEPAQTAMLFECDAPTRNAAGGRAQLPQEPRHTGGNNFGLADGHVKWLPSQSRYEEKLRW